MLQYMMIWFLTCVAQALQVSMEVFMLCIITLVTVMLIVDECRFDGAIRTVVDSDDACENSCDETYTILLDSGADASIFPASLLNKGTPACGAIGKLHDAQGAEIPVQSIQDMEIRLKDLSGRNIVLRERVAISDRVTQPIVCFGHLLESGWGNRWCPANFGPPLS